MSDYEDYENNLAFPPTTDRTQSTIELVEKIEKLEKQNKKLTKQLEIAITGLYDVSENGKTRWDMNQAKWYLDRVRELKDE